jgi:hypothetical protein
MRAVGETVVAIAASLALLCRALCQRPRGEPTLTDRRLRILRAALGFLDPASRVPELRLRHAWLDAWTVVGLITVGVERLGSRLSLRQIAAGEWLASFSGHLLFSSAGFAVVATPSEAKQIAAAAAVRRPS